ncbi:hypothetical protein DFH09DRAFT_1373745 [Mycena vulgaris]|nr:hypothetical protein DFH09DRAFT_1373745 [Mycena vulgaris]
MSQHVLLTGPILAGTQLNWALLGTLTLQVYIFHVAFPKERTSIKALVYTIFLLDVAQTAISSHFAYMLLVNGWGDSTVLTNLPWSSAAGPIFTGIISASVQIFFAWRIYVLRGSNPYAIGISGLIVLLALMQSFSAIISDALFALTTELSEVRHLMVGVKLWLFGSAACDIVITATMLEILFSCRRRTPWKRTDSTLTKLIYTTVNSGAITSVVAIADVVLFMLYPDNYLHETPAFMLGKVYSNVLVATLNARTRDPVLNATTPADAREAGTELQWRHHTSDEEQQGSQKWTITTETATCNEEFSNKRYLAAAL